MKYIESIQKGFQKVENFFSNLNFIAKISKALSVGIKACNDELLGRNIEQLKIYLETRKDATEKL